VPNLLDRCWKAEVSNLILSLSKKEIDKERGHVIGGRQAN
jgi:hypothetical protein